MLGSAHRLEFESDPFSSRLTDVGCGKTEIARRMALLAAAPFIKVEATKYTEVGYKGAGM